MQRSAALDAVFEPVQSPSTVEGTVERLGTAIRLGLLPARSQLPRERDLAELLRISRSTLREALLELRLSGHLVSVRGRSGGTFVVEAPPLAVGPVTEPPSWEARAVLDERVATEIGATVLAAERATPDDLAVLDALVEHMAEADVFEDYRRADMRFHIAVAEAAHSPKLVTTMTEVQGQMNDLLAGVRCSDRVLARSNSQHRRLVALMRTRDTAGAVGLMRKHIESTERLVAGSCFRAGAR
jgi:DNA-binding FadR family transcriptional regulator